MPSRTTYNKGGAVGWPPSRIRIPSAPGDPEDGKQAQNGLLPPVTENAQPLPTVGDPPGPLPLEDPRYWVSATVLAARNLAAAVDALESVCCCPGTDLDPDGPHAALWTSLPPDLPTAIAAVASTLRWVSDRLETGGAYRGCADCGGVCCADERCGQCGRPCCADHLQLAGPYQMCSGCADDWACLWGDGHG